MFDNPLGELNAIIKRLRALEETVVPELQKIPQLLEDQNELLRVQGQMMMKLLSDQGSLQGHEEPCYYCQTPCNVFAGNPSEWPVALSHPDEPGKAKYHHAGCVQDRLHGRVPL